MYTDFEIDSSNIFQKRDTFTTVRATSYFNTNL